MHRFASIIKRVTFHIAFIVFPAFAWAQENAAPEGVFATEITTAKKLVDLLVEFCVKYSFQALGGVLVVILGWVAARFVAKFLEKLLLKKNVDVTVAKFLVGIIKIIIIALAALIALGKFGITIAPFIAAISVIGFGASFAVQGPLSNYAAGATLIFTKPFKVGDIVEAADVTGEVTDMTLARTEMKTLDGTVIFIPNKHVIGEVIHNYSSFKKLDLTIGVSYESDIDKAIGIFKDVVAKDERLAKQPEPKIGISEFADSSINIYARLWCKQSDYYDILFSVNRKIFEEFGRNNISIPFPQRDVHIFDKTKNA